MNILEISPSEVYQLQQTQPNVLLIDVREPEEFASAAAPQARNYPLSTFALDELTADLGLTPTTSAPTLYFICARGGRSLRAAEFVAAAGYPAVYNVSGGMHRWAESGLPLLQS